MDIDTRQKIHDELVTMLNREPSEQEIMNGQTDINIMHKVQNRKNKEILDKVAIKKVL